MNRKLASLFFLCATGICHASETTPLFSLVAKGQAVENGKTLDMAFNEIARDEQRSLAEVRFTSGGSVSSSMFMLRGACGVARVRGKQFFRAEQIARQPITFRIDFPGQATEQELHPKIVAQKVFSIEECTMLGF